MADLKKNDRYDWIIADCNSDQDGINFYRFYGSVEEVKKKLVEMVMFDMNEDKESWDFGTENTEDVTVFPNEDELYAYGCYSYYHIDYTARKFMNLEYV